MPTAEQIREIEAKIRDAQQAEQEARDAENNGDFAESIDRDLEARNLYQEAIALADAHYGLPKPDNVDTPVFDPGIGGEGATSANGRIRIGRDAFVFGDPPVPSPAWLASSKIHEMYAHGAQIIVGGGDWNDTPIPEKEVEAYNLELSMARRTGITAEMIAEIRRRKRTHYNNMPEERRRIWRAKEPWLAFAYAIPHGPDEAFAMVSDDMYDMLGLFKVPGETAIVNEAGEVIAHAGESLRSIALKHTHGDIARLIRVNRNLALRLSDFIELVVGPSTRPAETEAGAASADVNLVAPPKTTPAGVLSDEPPEVPAGRA